MMLELVTGLLGSATGGGLFGIVGTWLKGREERSKMKLEFDHEQAMADRRREELQLEADLALQQTEAEFAGKQAIAETEAEASMDVAASQLRAASYKHDRASYGGGIIDAIRGAMRPLITVYLLIVVTVIAFQMLGIDDLFGAAPDEARAVVKQVVQDVVFLAVTAVTWWFGTRPNSRARK